MARIERANPSVVAPVKQAVLIDPNVFKFTGAGEGLKAVGAAVTNIGEDIKKRNKEEQKVLNELAKRKRDMQDRIGTSNANAIMEKAELDMAEELVNTPPAKRAEVREKWAAHAKSNIVPLDLSTDSRALVQNKTDIWAQRQIDLGEIDDVELAAEEALLLTTDDYIKALVEGDEEEIITNEDALNKVLAIKMTETEAIQYKEKMEEVAVKQMTDNARTEVRELAAGKPDLAIKLINKEQEVRKTGKPSDFLLVSNEDLLSAKKLAKSTIVSNGNAIQNKFDLAVGVAAKSFSDKIADKDLTLTESDVWDEPILGVDTSKQKEVAAFRTTWAGIARGIAEREQKKISGKKTKEDKEKYTPKIVASLKTEARNTTGRSVNIKVKGEDEKEVEVTVTDVVDIKMRAAQALTDNIIDDGDFETIVIDAEKTFKTATDKAIDDGESQFASIQLKGTSNESLTPWISAQVLAIKAEDITTEFVNKLLVTFQNIGKAKQWSVNQTRNEVIATIDKKKEDGESVTVNDIRLLYIQAQKRWLRKNDTELVEEYKDWVDPSRIEKRKKNSKKN